MKKDASFTVAIIGRPNVGKSTLFNRLIGRRMAIETPIAGTTRDRLFGEVDWQGQKFTLMDVAGVETGSKKEIDRSIQKGIDLAYEEADLILFIVDWNEKDDETDKRIARKLRQIKKPVLMVVNKADNIGRQEDLQSFIRLGNFPIVPISAISGSNTGDLLSMTVKMLRDIPERKQADKKEKADIELAIIGRPNVGKSTLLNTIIGEKRAIVSEEAGTTRDIVSISFFHKGKKIEIADTAGIRRPGKVGKDTIESYSVLRTYQALKQSQVVVVIIDSTEGLVAADTHILGKAKESGKGIILAINKVDLTSGEDYRSRCVSELQRRLNFVPWIPVVFISALNKTNIKFLLDQVIAVANNRGTVIPQDDLCTILEEAKKSNQQLISLEKIKQVRSNPPIFSLSYKGKKAPHYTQIRYLENKIRDFYPLNGTPIFIDLDRPKPKN